MRVLDADLNDDDDDGDGSNSSSLTWMMFKERGKLAYERGDYIRAISNFGRALQVDRHCPASERQIILSNIVAARLKIGGPAQAEAAVENAKQCVALNDRWAKGHMRLASAYIALGGHSNDACNALQRALQLDPGYHAARDMLIRELRRDHASAYAASRRSASTSSATTTTTTTTASTNERPEPSAPPEYLDDQGYTTSPNSAATVGEGGSSTNGSTEQQQDPPQPRQRAPNNPYQDQQPLDDHVSILDRISFYYNRAKMWYFAQSDDLQTLLKILLGLVCLYVAFGGRFGLGHYIGSGPKGRHHGKINRPRRGNYNSGNAYDQYYEGQRRSTTSETRRGDYSYRGQGEEGDYHSNRNNKDSHQQHTTYRDSYYNNENDHYSSSRQYSQQGNRGGGFSFQMPNLFDGSFQSMMMLAGIAYVCHRNGMNPMQILVMLNMMMNNGRRRHRGGMFMGGGGFPGFGGGGFGRRRW